MEISIEIDVIAIILAVGAALMWLMRRTIRIYDYLGTMLPARWMFVVYAVSFAICSVVVANSLASPQPIAQLDALFQAAVFSFVVLAVVSCAFAVAAIIHNHVTRTPIYYFDRYGRWIRID